MILERRHTVKPTRNEILIGRTNKGDAFYEVVCMKAYHYTNLVEVGYFIQGDVLSMESALNEVSVLSNLQ